jgi:hypothetical protein
MQDELIFRFIRTMRVLMREHARATITPGNIASIDDIVTVLTSIQRTRKRHVNTAFAFHIDSFDARFHGSFENFPLGHLKWDWRHTGEQRPYTTANRQGESIRFLLRIDGEPVLYNYRHLGQPEVNNTWAHAPDPWTDAQYTQFIEVLGKPTPNEWEPGSIEDLDLSKALKQYRRKTDEFTRLECTRLDRRTHPLRSIGNKHLEEKTDHADVVDLSPPRTENGYDKAASS